MTEKKTNGTTKARAPRKALTDNPDPRSEVQDPANTGALRLFKVRQRERGVKLVAARSPKEARILLAYDPRGYNTDGPEGWSVRIGRAVEVPGVTGEEARRKGT